MSEIDPEDLSPIGKENMIIPRSQYDALMKAAAWVLHNCPADCPLVAALRAAGIQTETIHD